MTKALFITGTDTDIGKTFVSCLLLKAFNAIGLKTFGIKPIASGGERDDEGKIKNQDALNLQRHASVQKSYHIVNPILFEAPIAANISLEKKSIYSKEGAIKKKNC